MNNELIYLDYAGSTPVDNNVLRAMMPYFSEKFYNPSAMYLRARSVKADLANARGRVAQIIGAKPNEIVFTSGATEANNLVVRGVMEQFPGVELVVSAIEHDSVLEPAKLYDCKVVKVDKFGIIDVASLKKQITNKTVLVSVMLANNELGTIQPIAEIAKIITDIKRQRQKDDNNLPIYLHSDAAQAVNYLDVHVGRLGIDFMSVNGGKIYGPKQTGFLFAKSGTLFKPQILGGGQERGLRSGTENVAGIIGLSEALRLASSQRKEAYKNALRLQEVFLEELSSANFEFKLNGSKKHRLPNNVHITIDGIDNERIMMELDERGIICAVGSACSASSQEPSHVLKAIGLSDEQARSSLRFTFGKQTTTEMIKKTVKTIKDICQNTV